MSRDPIPTADEDDPDTPPEPTGRLGTTRPATLVVAALVGLVLGWLVRPVTTSLDGSAPRVGWAPGLALLLAAAILGAVALSTHRTLQRGRGRLEPHQAVNRLVLAKSCALAGAFVAGGYLGYTLTWVGLTAELAGERMRHSLLAAAGAVLVVVASLLLERACRVRGPEAGH